MMVNHKQVFKSIILNLLLMHWRALKGVHNDALFNKFFMFTHSWFFLVTCCNGSIRKVKQWGHILLILNRSIKISRCRRL